MSVPQRFLVLLAITVVPALLLPLCLVLAVDPFGIYHAPWPKQAGLQANQRYQNAGLINRYLADPAAGYDSVIVGTSMSENFTGAEVSRVLGWHKTLRLPMPGAVASEQIAVLAHALATGRVRHVLLEVHPFLYQDAYRQKRQEEADHALYFPAFLYNETWRDDWPYVFNVDTLALSWKRLAGPSVQGGLTPETLGYWGNEASVEDDRRAFNAPGHLQQLREQVAGFSVAPLSSAEIDALDYPVLNETLLPLLRRYCNRDVDFELFVPPWPRFRYQKSAKVAQRSVYLPRHLLQGMANCRNMRLHDFDLLPFAGDLDNYRDEQHYLPPVNTVLLERIAARSNVLSLDAVAEFERQFVDLLNHYVPATRYPAPLPVPETLHE